MMPIALSYARFGSTITRTGGPYEYVRESMGDSWALLTGIGFWIAYIVVIATLGRALSRYAAYIIPLAGLWPWPAVIAIAAIWLITLANILGVRYGGLLNDCVTLVKVASLLTFTLLLIPWIRLEYLRPEGRVSWNSMATAFSAVLWAYLGFEAISPPSEEIIKPEKSVPRSTIYSMIIVMLIYLTVSVAAIGGVSAPSLASSKAPLAYALAYFYGDEAGRVMFVAATISIFGCLAATILPNARVAYALARDGYLPRWITSLNSRGAPASALVVQATLASILALIYGFVKLYPLSDLTSLVPYLTVTLALLLQDKDARWRMIGLLGLLASLYLMYATIEAEVESLLGLAVILAITVVASIVRRTD